MLCFVKALHVLMLITLAVDDLFQAKVAGIAQKWVGTSKQAFQAAPPKSFSRAHNKMSSPSDYRFHAKPRCIYNADVARNLVSADTPQQVMQVLGDLSNAFGGQSTSQPHIPKHPAC